MPRKRHPIQRYSQTDLQVARNHVAEAKRRIAGQRALMIKLAADGHKLDEAKRLLDVMLKLLTQMEKHRAEIEADLAGRGAIEAPGAEGQKRGSRRSGRVPGRG